MAAMLGRGRLLLLSLLLLTLPFLFNVRSISAQNSAHIAFLNSSSQLVVSSGDGGMRWIVTDPGETLVMPVGFSWSPDGGRLFFAVGSGSDASLRVGDVASQSVSEFGRASGQLSGGDWAPNGSSVILGVNNQVLAYPVGGGDPSALVNGRGPVTLHSAFDGANSQPNLAQSRSLSPDGRFLFYMDNGRNTLLANGSASALPGTNDANGRQNGIWSDAAPLVAYWGYESNSLIAVTDAENGQTITLDSGRSMPISPVAWIPGLAHLIYRDNSTSIRIADLSCLQSGCGDNPLQNGVELLPATATEIQVTANRVYFVDNGTAQVIDLSCAGNGNCAGSAQPFGTNVAPQTWLDLGGNTLSYTAFTQDAYNAADREVRVADLDCLPGCAPQPAQAGSVGGMVAPNGGFVVIEDGGLSVLRLYDKQVTSLSDRAGGSLLATARWNG
jgi:hypothetical protein